MSHIKRFVLAILVLVIGQQAVYSQTKLIEEVTREGDEIVIPYKKFELENGLTLIIHEDDSDPLVHVDVTYHVGSAREELYKSGFAHFFEHMMFQGSENVADEEHIQTVTNAGGTMNGTTNRDRTNYFQTLPSNQLEVALWLEADRMGFFLNAVTQEKFEIQRSTVKNEKAQNYDNSAYGQRFELNASGLYPFGHPYSWLPIGKVEDLDRVDVDDLKNFFLRWYGPNNATLTVGGNVNAEEVVALVEKYFGVIERGPDVEDMYLDPVTIEEDRYISYVDNNIRFPMVNFTYPTVPRFHPDEAPLDYLAQILGTGRSSYFYQKFVLTQKAIQTAVFHPASELAGEFQMLVLPFPGQTLTDFELEMRNILDEFANEGVSDDDMTKIKASFESGFINGLQSVSGKVSQLASYETFANNANYIELDIERYNAVTKEDIMRVFNEYIYNKPAVILSVLPNDGGVTQPAQPDNYAIPTEGNNPFPTTDYSGLSYSRPEGDNFDRSVKPTPGVAPLISVPEYWTSTTENGIEFIGTTSDEVPSVFVQLRIKGGHKMDAYHSQKAGLASLTASLMSQSTENYTSEEIAEELRLIASSISFNTSDNSTTMNIFSLKKNLDRTLELAEEMLYRPAFNETDFTRLQQQQLEGIRNSYQNPSSIANVVYDRLIYGDEHILSLPGGGIEETVNRITIEDVRAFYDQYYTPDLSEVVVVGQISKDEILPKLDFLNSWESTGAELPVMPSAKKSDATKIYLVDKPAAPQSELRLGYMTELTYDPTGDFYKAELMNYNLGGSLFNNRINLNLREDKAWTYGAGSYFSASQDPGPFTALASVNAVATDSAVVEILKEIQNFRMNGVTDEEMEFMRNSIGQADALDYETQFQKAGFVGTIIRYNLDSDYKNVQSNLVQSISKEEINELAQQYLDLENMIILVVGDAASQREKLETLGYEIVDVTTNGDIIIELEEDSQN